VIAGHGDFLPTYVRPRYLSRESPGIGIVTGVVGREKSSRTENANNGILSDENLTLLRDPWRESRV
jgi:hypothetical protein